MSANLLKLNPSETIGLPKQLPKIENPSLDLHDSYCHVITRLISARKLGVLFDSRSHFFHHQILSFHVRDLRRLRPILDLTTARNIATA
jgi:hypothetical protein